jgi:hypothetical protein
MDERAEIDWLNSKDGLINKLGENIFEHIY